MREVPLSPNFLSIELRRRLILIVLRAIFRQFVQAASRCPKYLGRAKTTVWTRILVVINDLLELPLIIIILNLSVIIKTSPHLMILLLAS